MVGSAGPTKGAQVLKVPIIIPKHTYHKQEVGGTLIREEGHVVMLERKGICEKVSTTSNTWFPSAASTDTIVSLVVVILCNPVRLRPWFLSIHFFLSALNVNTWTKDTVCLYYLKHSFTVLNQSNHFACVTV